MKHKRPTVAVIDLGAIRHNIVAIKRCNPNSKMMAVVKADAYGHGAVRIGRCALEAGADCLGVATLPEAAELRAAGLDCEIMIIGALMADECADAVSLGVDVGVCAAEQVRAMQQAAGQSGVKAQAYAKIETGFNRLGVRPDELPGLLGVFRQCPDVQLKGLFTHFAGADMADDAFVFEQFAQFKRAAVLAQEEGFSSLVLHAANSAAALRYPELALDMVRCGIILYGCEPSDEFSLGVELRPSMQWKTAVAMVKDVPAGQTVGYGMTYEAPSMRRVATLPVGYADGYRRNMQGKAYVLAGGKRCPVVGRICMDHTMVDVTDAGNVSVGDEVILLGRQGDEAITAFEMGQWQDSINYEVTCGVSKRVAREYIG